MSKRTPTSPVRAHHRLMRSLLSTIQKKKDPTPEQLDKVAKVFTRMGGSWERVFKGSAEDMVLLKRVLKIAAKRSVMSDKQDWK